MKKLFAVLAAAALPVVGLAPAAQAANTPHVVNGHDALASNGLWNFANTCGAPEGFVNENPTKLVSTTHSSGESSLGWDFTQTGNEVGPLAYWAQTSAVNKLSTRFFSDGFVEGHAIALFDVYGDSGASGWYVGTTNTFNFDSNNGTLLNAGTAGFDWYLVDSSWNRRFDLPEYDRDNKTIAQMGTEWGDHGGVWTGFVMGCNTNAFYLDDLTVGDATNTSSYDLETPQIESMAHIEYSLDGRTVRNGNLTVNIGRGVRVLGHAHGHMDGVYFTGQGTLWARQPGKSWHEVATDTFDPDFYASFAQSPKHTTQYFFSTSADAVHTSAYSETMTVNVRADVVMSVDDKTIREGQRIVLSGKIRPGNVGQKVKLQRKVGGVWKTLSSGRTARKGKYRLSAVAGKPGTWTVRVLVESGNGNLGTSSRKVDVKVTKAPPPPEPTKPPVVVDPVAPTYSAPAPPDPVRGTNSGRIVPRAQVPH